MLLDKRTAQKIRSAQDEHTLLTASLQVIKEADAQSRADILNAGDYREEETQKRITNPNHDWTMPEADYTEYLKLVHAKNMEKGIAFNKNRWDEPPTYPTEQAIKEVEEKLIDLALEIMPAVYKSERETINANRNHWKHRPRIIELILRLDARAR